MGLSDKDRGPILSICMSAPPMLLGGDRRPRFAIIWGQPNAC